MEEPIAAARLAWELSRETCSVDPATGESCRWHHGLWPWLRALGLATSPGRFAEFYRAAFARALAGRTAARILISGAADHEMLAQVQLASSACGVAADVTAVDLCETPLALSRRFVEGSGLKLATARSDIFAYSAAAPFDLVCSDSFLGQFAPPARERLIARWAALLAPGGALVTVNRLRPEADAAQPVTFTAEQARAFVAAVRSKAEALPAAARPPLGELEALAARYASRQRAWPVRSGADVAALVARGGFEVARLEVAPIASAAPGATAPTLAGGAPYARIEARARR